MTQPPGIDRLLAECWVFVDAMVRRHPGGSGPWLLKQLEPYRPATPPQLPNDSEGPEGAD